MTKDEFLRAWQADPWNPPLAAEEIPVPWMRAAWRIDAIRETVLDLMGQNVCKAGRLGLAVGYLHLLDKILSRLRVVELYRGLRDFRPEREADFREEFERGFPSHRAALPPVRSKEQLDDFLVQQEARFQRILEQQGQGEGGS